MRCVSVVTTAAFFVFFTATAGAVVVSADLRRLDNRASYLTLCRGARNRGNLRHLRSCACGAARINEKHEPARFELDFLNHLLEQICAFKPERRNGIALSIAVEPDVFAQIVDSFKVVHPLNIYRAKEQLFLEFAHINARVLADALLLLVNLTDEIKHLCLRLVNIDI